MKFEDLRIDTKTEKPYTCNRLQCLNMSTIFTELIKQAARCESYSSDICYEIQEIMNGISGITPPETILGENGEGKTYMFGFRNMGVDHDNFIKSRLDGSPYCDVRLLYRRIYLLRFEPDHDCEGFVNVWFKRAM